MSKILGFLFILICLPSFNAFGESHVLRLKIWEGYAPEAYVRAFEERVEKKYTKKVKLEISFANDSEDFYDLVREKKVDLITVSLHSIEDILFNYHKTGLLLTPDLDNIPHYANMINDLKEAAYTFSNKILYGVPLAHGPYGLAYNTNAFKQPPQTWAIFWDPAYQNKYVIGVEEYIYNINITALVMGYPQDAITSYDALNNPAFKKKLRQLVANSGGGWVGVDKPLDLAGMSFAMAWGDSLTPLRRMGEVWKMADPVEGTMWWVDAYLITWALADKPFLKKIAEEWINQSLSPEYQTRHIVRELGSHPVVTHLTDTLTKEEKERIQTDLTSKAFKDKRILQHSYSQRDRNGLKLLWDEAMEGVSVKRQDRQN